MDLSGRGLTGRSLFWKTIGHLLAQILGHMDTLLIHKSLHKPGTSYRSRMGDQSLSRRPEDLTHSA